MLCYNVAHRSKGKFLHVASPLGPWRRCRPALRGARRRAAHPDRRCRELLWRSRRPPSAAIASLSKAWRSALTPTRMISRRRPRSPALSPTRGSSIMNGLDYDHWMEQLLEASDDTDRVVLDVAALVGAEEGGNPHLWYDPGAVPALAGALAATLSAADPEGAAEYESRFKDYAASLEELNQKIAAIRDRYAGTEVVASEPVFGLMAEALGLKVLGTDFQHAIMNETEPSARAIAEIEDDLRSGRARVLFYNSQVVDPLTERLLAVGGGGQCPGRCGHRVDAQRARPMSAGCSTSSTRPPRRSRRPLLERRLFRPRDPVARRGADSRRCRVRRRRGRIRRRARAERLRQDDNDQGDPRPRSAGLRADRPCSGRPPAAACRASLTCPRRGARPRPFRSPAATSSPRPSTASAGGCPWLLPPTGARSTTRSPWSAGPALAQRPLSRMSGGERQRLLIAGALIGQPAPPPARRAADQPRPAPAACRRRPRPPALARTRPDRPLQRP